MTREEPLSVARTLLDHPYRRVVLALLDATEAPVALHPLASAVLTYNVGEPGRSHVVESADETTTGDAPTTAAVEMMAAQLHHVHLPRLGAAGILQYDAEANVVRSWCHPAVGDRWVTAPPAERLEAIIRTARTEASTASLGRLDRPSDGQQALD